MEAPVRIELTPPGPEPGALPLSYGAMAERTGFEPANPFRGYRLAGGWSPQSPSLSVVGLGGIKPPSLAYQTSALSLSYSPMAGSGGIEPPKPCGPTVFETAPSTSRTLPLVAPARIELALSGCKPDALPLHHGAMVPLERFELPTPRFEAWRSNSAELQGHFGGPAGTRTQDPCLQGRRVPCYATGPQSP